MKIAQIAPLMEAVPPKLYGGTERIVAYLCDELVRLGHDVTLFASGDSVTTARLEAVWPRAMRLDDTIGDYLAPHVMMLERVAASAHRFDVLHFHIDYLSYPLQRRLATPSVTTLHGRLDLPVLQPLYALFGDTPVVSISDSQRVPLPQANFVRTVYHGLPDSLLSPGAGEGGYLAFLGRISPEKGPDTAIRIAGRAGMKIKIAAKVDRVDLAYFKERIEPLLSLPHVEFIGEIADSQKSDFLGSAAALLFPIAWREPFGLAMIEAMACGTPVIAMRCGSVPEIIEDGVSGFIVDDESEAVQAIAALNRLDRGRIRRCFDERFSARRMAEDYVRLYGTLVAAGGPLRETG